MEQPFDLKATMDIHFAILYKNYKKKQKIDIYSLSSVFTPNLKADDKNSLLRIKIPGRFKGIYITQLKYEGVSEDFSTGEKKISFTSTLGY